MHLVVNNQLGFTTDCHKGRSSWYCTDLLRTINAPAIHVNADDPEAVVIATRLAMDYLTTFGKVPSLFALPKATSTYHYVFLRPGYHFGSAWVSQTWSQ